ncbi:hypothetical protein CEXT_665071 [Caerostris extrusa]|uniref:Uncharacterized protein n=1 Tax=Caerostris extrusa TaxID=172846 RepID=A0AAV4RJU3_CAEEX|nr:hypothetical protein CEXT_665071 [Caerostris extrusa]
MLCTWPLASDSDIVWKKSQEKSTGSRSEGESVFPERRSKDRVRAAISLDAAQTSRHRCRGRGGERGTDRRFMNTPRHHGLRSRSTRTFIGGQLTPPRNPLIGFLQGISSSVTSHAEEPLTPLFVFFAFIIDC